MNTIENSGLGPLAPLNRQKLSKIDLNQRSREIEAESKEILSGMAIDREVFKKVYSAQPPKYKSPD